MNLLNKIKLKLVIIWNSLFYAMYGADRLFGFNGNASDSSINQTLLPGGVMRDLLEEKETEQVKEIRDEYYRILNEADKYKVELTMSVNESGDIEGETISAVAKKKNSSDFSKHCDIFDDGKYRVRLIQDNKHIENSHEDTFNRYSKKNGIDIWDYNTTLTIGWGDITPRFKLNKFVTKIVVKTISNTESFVEFYLPTISGQFTKLDAIVVSELNKIFKDKNYKSDIKNINTIEFVTDKAWNCENLCLFTFDNVKFDDLFVYDGNFVLRYYCHNVISGESITEKYKTKELTEKYNNKSPKKDATDIFAIERNICGVNFGKYKFETNENSD